jgi:hypothetical protein
MVLKRRLQTPKEYIQTGMAFFLIGIFASQVADGRLVGAFFISLIHNEALVDTLQGASVGFSIPLLCFSIYFNLRGFGMIRSK